MRKASWFVVALVSAGLVAGCGGDEHSTGASSGKELDRAFARAMIPHHESAVEMARIAQQRGENPFVKKLAGNIIRTQTAEIATLRAADKRLAAAGADVGSLGMSHDMMGMSGDTDMLKTADPFDEAFLKMMIPHHEGAIEMAKVEMTKGSDPELMKLADAIISAQDGEITAMRNHLDDSGAGGSSMDSMSGDDD